ncbi:MAG: alpha/beta fold hydrolase [Pirellulaceae bacterium]
MLNHHRKFRTIYEHPDPAIELYWFCHAGAGSASLVRSARDLTVPVALHVATLPGREERYRDGLTLSLDQLVDEFLDELLSKTVRPFAFIGHSFGSLIAYLLAHRLIERDRSPSALTVMTLAAPDRIDRISKTGHLSDEAFLDYLDNRFGGVPLSLRRNAEAIRLFVPIVRYDMQLLESYVHSPKPPLKIPVTALAGQTDRAVSFDDMAFWERHTSGIFYLEQISGGHFFPVDQVPFVVQKTLTAASC